MAQQKVKQVCKVCKRVTTQIRSSSSEAWICLCCESAKNRTDSEVSNLRDTERSKTQRSF